MNEKILIRVDKNGTQYFHHRETCPRCGGTGIVEIYRRVNGGDCFECWGAGFIEYDTKEYTPEYEAKLTEQRKKRAEKKLAEERKHAPERNAKFFEMNGFNAEGHTYVVLGKTYEIKDQLKAQGAKWDNVSNHWHMPTPPENREYLELTVDDMYDADAAGVYDWRNWRSFTDNPEEHYTYAIDQAEKALRAKESTSKHVGEVGEKLNLTVTYKHTASWESSYGYNQTTNLHTFEDAEGNVYVWKTGNYIEAEYGDKLTLQGTVKEHSEYNGIPQTVLTRCKITEVRV